MPIIEELESHTLNADDLEILQLIKKNLDEFNFSEALLSMQKG